MTQLANFANFLWLLTKIVFLMIILITMLVEMLSIIFRAIFARKHKEIEEEE